MVDVSDPALVAAYEDVRNDKTDTDWCVLRARGPPPPVLCESQHLLRDRAPASHHRVGMLASFSTFFVRSPSRFRRPVLAW